MKRDEDQSPGAAGVWDRKCGGKTQHREAISNVISWKSDPPPTHSTPPPQSSVIPLRERKKPSESWENLESPGAHRGAGSRSSLAQLADKTLKKESQRTLSGQCPTFGPVSPHPGLDLQTNHWKMTVDNLRVRPRLIHLSRKY